MLLEGAIALNHLTTSPPFLNAFLTIQPYSVLKTQRRESTMADFIQYLPSTTHSFTTPTLAKIAKFDGLQGKATIRDEMDARLQVLRLGAEAIGDTVMHATAAAAKVTVAAVQLVLYPLLQDADPKVTILEAGCHATRSLRSVAAASFGTLAALAQPKLALSAYDWLALAEEAKSNLLSRLAAKINSTTKDLWNSPHRNKVLLATALTVTSALGFVYVSPYLTAQGIVPNVIRPSPIGDNPIGGTGKSTHRSHLIFPVFAGLSIAVIGVAGTVYLCRNRAGKTVKEEPAEPQGSAAGAPPATSPALTPPPTGKGAAATIEQGSPSPETAEASGGDEPASPNLHADHKRIEQEDEEERREGEAPSAPSSPLPPEEPTEQAGSEAAPAAFATEKDEEREPLSGRPKSPPEVTEEDDSSLSSSSTSASSSSVVHVLTPRPQGHPQQQVIPGPNTQEKDSPPASTPSAPISTPVSSENRSSSPLPVEAERTEENDEEADEEGDVEDGGPNVSSPINNGTQLPDVTDPREKEDVVEA